MAVETKVACNEVRRGDSVQAFVLRIGGDGDRLAKVLDVRHFGANVVIDTDLGASSFLPINRSVIVWRQE